MATLPGERGVRAQRPNAEVRAKPTRRRFTAAYKLSVVERADRCTEPGEVGRLLLCEGLYSSQLSAWRKAAREGSLGPYEIFLALTPSPSSFPFRIAGTPSSIQIGAGASMR